MKHEEHEDHKETKTHSRMRRLWLIAGALVIALCSVGAWSRAVRLQQQRWIESARAAGLFVHDEPYTDQWQGPVDLNPVLSRLGVKFLMVLVRTNEDAEKLLGLGEPFSAPMVALYTTGVSASLVDEIERRFPSDETVEWKKRFLPKHQGEWMARRYASR